MQFLLKCNQNKHNQTVVILICLGICRLRIPGLLEGFLFFDDLVVRSKYLKLHYSLLHEYHID